MSHPALYGLFGAGGFGREVMPLLRTQLMPLIAAERAKLVFVVEAGAPQEAVNGSPVLTMDQFLQWKGERYFNIAIGESRARERIADLCLGAGAHPFSIQADNALILDNSTIGQGTILCPFAMVTSNAKIGRFVHANIYSYIAHDCVVGDFVTFAPKACCNGNVHIEDHAYIGTGALIRNGSHDKPLVIGRGAVVGMGAVVVKSVPAGQTVLGNPAQPLKERGA